MDYYDSYWFESEEEFNLFKMFLRSKQDEYEDFLAVSKFENLSYTSICLEPDEVIEFEEFKRKYNYPNNLVNKKEESKKYDL